jgi:hypothetical protein
MSVILAKKNSFKMNVTCTFQCRIIILLPIVPLQSITPIVNKASLVKLMSFDIIIIFLNLCVRTLNDTHFETEGVQNSGFPN